jgi:RNA polymerase sigma factor for flagellar operon FliA
MARDLQSVVMQYVADRSQGNKEAVVLAAVPIVRSIVGRISLPEHPLLSREDLENTGLFGLLTALESFDPEQGKPFITYAYGRIRGSIIDYIRSVDALPREKRRAIGEAQSAISVLQQVMGCEPGDQDVADYIGISLTEYQALLRDAQSRYSLSINASVGSDDGEKTIVEILPDEKTCFVLEDIEEKSFTEYIQKLISQLPEREQTILALYYYEGTNASRNLCLYGQNGSTYLSDTWKNSFDT